MASRASGDAKRCYDALQFGRVCKETQRWDDMAAYCRRAEQLRPGWKSALVGIMFAGAEKARQTRRAEDWRAALAAVDYALAIRPDLIQWRAKRAHALWMLGQKKAALQEMEALVAQEPNYHRYIWLARYQLGCGHWRAWWRTQLILFPKVLHRVTLEQEQKAGHDIEAKFM
jgi:tetratricopeptide (TPR) repeat protein